MIYTDFSECAFIEKEMWYYTYYDFCDNCDSIKYLFNKLSFCGKIFYRYYVYANIHMRDTFKNAIWDFLNCDDPEYYNHLIELKKQYKAK